MPTRFRQNDIMAAILMNDLDEACAYLQRIGRIQDTGNMAAVVFHDFDWETADLTAREVKIREYVQVYVTEAIRR